MLVTKCVGYDGDMGFLMERGREGERDRQTDRRQITIERVAQVEMCCLYRLVIEMHGQAS